ncbi:ABC transporter substrate-binding protein [Streptoalloteichus tenebrarius]|uniref:ABC transporter substrate-binding protein n=1 Tax=Streptoalloteichus tenebrarius (strain ATCC 17920 / DSM 40477 / JCM 4838 / CBS 697.72 / NBRC 16177 / NCIMB 11028 / NRRL B-12390 / A12253. 1 / ISP 5477) TaxID=1933 RepID=UPI0020A45B75|nr:ABC transporter substrate-binding protein [Streptoalloteichus tenebrarius]
MRRGRWSRALAAASVVVAVLASAGCRESRTLPLGEDGQPEITIMVGGVDKVIYLPAMLTERLGGFERQGLRVKLLSEQSGANAETTLLSGDVHAVVGFYDHTIDLQAKDQCITSVVQLADVPGEVELVAANKADEIRSPADFRGRKLGVTSLGSSTDFLTRYLAGSAGLSTSDYTTVKVGAGQTFIAGMTNGGIDAGMTTDPTVAQLVNSGKAKIIADMRTEEGTRQALGGLYPASSVYMKCEIVERYPEVVQKLANAFVETLRWLKQHTPEEIADRMPPSFANAGRDLYVQSIRDSVGMFNGTGRMKPEGAQNVLNVLSQFSTNVKPKKDRIDLSRTYTTRFVDNVPAS